MHVSISEVRAAKMRARVTSSKRKKPMWLAGNPVRLVVTKRTKRVVGYISSAKMNGMIPWESQLERDHIRTLEAENTVRAYYVQPETISYVLGGKQHRYTPDVRVEYSNGEVHIVEVKFLKDAMHPKNQRAFEIFRAMYGERNITFRVATEVSIRKERNIENITNTLYLRDCYPDPGLAMRLRSLFDLNPPKTLGDLEAALNLTEADRGLLLGMAARAHFSLDLGKVATADTPVFPSPIPPH